MNAILEFLNQNSGALMVVFTLFVAASTVVYAILTWRLVAETRSLRKAQTEPRIEVALRQREEFLGLAHIVVRNIGLGPAYDIRFSQRVISGGVSAEHLLAELTQSNFLRAGLNYLGPGEHMTSSLTELLKDFEGKMNSILEFSVNYRSASAKPYSHFFSIDVGQFRGVSQFQAPHLHKIAERVESIKNDVHNIANGSARVQVDIHTAQDRAQERKQQEELWGMPGTSGQRPGP